jgi:translation initiation factor IF-3
MILKYSFSTSKEKLCQHAQNVIVQKWLKMENTLEDNDIGAKHVHFNTQGLHLAVGQRAKRQLRFCCIL